jgi:Concanavalin A-like lectin/glucanases superfamily
MLKAQSAMEYLMTYSWALIIIVVVLASLYALGFFNSNTFAARAQPGACQVYRPYGPGTLQLVNLQGVCGTELPKTVASFGGNGKITVANSVYLGISNTLTIAMWIYASSPAPASQSIVSKTGTYSLGITNSGANVVFATNTVGSVSAAYPNLNAWHFVAATYNAAFLCIYVDGKLSGSCASQTSYVGNLSNVIIGNGFKGELSNIQIYNTSLNSNQISVMYGRGIGGPPLILQNLEGWWPLNSDMNDYSGNGDNGAANSISFVASWTSGYSH